MIYYNTKFIPPEIDNEGGLYILEISGDSSAEMNEALEAIKIVQDKIRKRIKGE